jgi:hypothetical protein
MNNSRPVTVSNTEVLRALDERTAGADHARLDRLHALRRVAGARNATLEREHERLVQKHGEDHPLAAAAAARLEAGNASLRALAFEIGRTSLQPPKPSTTAWTVFGIVCAQDGTPLEGVEVAVVDASGKKIAPGELVPTETDGVFSIVLAQPPDNPPGKTTGKQDKPEKDNAGSVHLEVFRSGTRRIAVDAVQFAPAAGVVDYREIVVTPTRAAGGGKGPS